MKKILTLAMLLTVIAFIGATNTNAQSRKRIDKMNKAIIDNPEFKEIVFNETKLITKNLFDAADTENDTHVNLEAGKNYVIFYLVDDEVVKSFVAVCSFDKDKATQINTKNTDSKTKVVGDLAVITSTGSRVAGFELSVKKNEMFLFRMSTTATLPKEGGYYSIMVIRTEPTK
jgi:hypothetical protein